jgi:hypothetical protein
MARAGFGGADKIAQVLTRAGVAHLRVLSTAVRQGTVHSPARSLVLAS